MNKIASKFQIGVAATAIAAAATLMPISTAQASPVAPAPAAPVTQILGTKTLIGSDAIAQQLSCVVFGLICAGPRGDLPPSQRIFSIPLAGWWLGNLAICSFGISIKQGAYGSLSISRSSSC